MKKKHLFMAAGAILAAIIIIVVIILCTGCKASKNSENENTASTESIKPTPTKLPTPTPAPTAAPTAVPTKEPTKEPEPTPDLHPGQKQSLLTGEWIDEKEANKRPFAIMLNNLKIAAPQSGIGDAAILYEALVEAGITRFMGIFEGMNAESVCAERIGSVRSARHYFCSFADEYDAIFIHYGQTSYAKKKIKALKLDDIEGTYAIGEKVFYRDKTIKAPHNAFASYEGIIKGINELGIRTEYEENYEGHFLFNDNIEIPSSDVAAVKVSLPYSSYISPYFLYDEETGLYMRYQFDEPHTDYNTGLQLGFNNLIIQFVEEWNIDENGYQTMNIEDAEGTGYYLAGGKAVLITWKKNEAERYMRYFDSDGNELKINKGKTFISVFPNYRKEKVTFE